MLLRLFSNRKTTAETDEHLPNRSHAASKGWNRGLSPELLILKPEPTTSSRSAFPQHMYTELRRPVVSAHPVSRVSLRLSAGTKDVIQSYNEGPTGIASGQLGKLRPQAKK